MKGKRLRLYKRIASIVLVLFMVVGLVPVTPVEVKAAEVEGLNDEGHTHDFTYTKERDNSIRVNCTDQNCEYYRGYSVGVNPPEGVNTPEGDLVYYYKGEKYEAKIVCSRELEGIVSISGISYKDKDGSQLLDVDAPTEVGTYTAEITVGNQVAAISFTIEYFPTPSNAYTIENGYKDGDIYWIKGGIPVEVYAPEGYEIARCDLNDEYSNIIYFNQNEGQRLIRLKEESGYMTDCIPITDNIKWDGTAPTGSISLSTGHKWETLLGQIGFTNFYDKTQTVTISATDGESGLAKIEYFVADSLPQNNTEAGIRTFLEAIDENDWEVYAGPINLSMNSKNVVYAKLTDNVGNVSFISSNGIVLYSDSSVTSTATREYKAGTDLEVSYASNGNTLDKVVYNNQVLEEDRDYTVDTDKVTFNAAWLDNYLDAGTHEITFVFNPQGVDTEAGTLNKKLTLTVTPVEIFVVDATASSRDYDGTKSVAITGLTLSRVKDTDNVGVSFSNLTGTISSANVGNYTRVTFEELSKFVTLTGADKDNYKLVYESGTEIGTNVTISKATATVVTAPIVNTLTFTDRAQALVKAGVTNDGTFMYSLSENGEYTSNIPTATEVGDYTVWYYVKGDTNHTDSGKTSVMVSIKEGPYIENEEGKMDWEAILDEVEDVVESDTKEIVTVDMNGTTVVPGDVLENIKGKDVTVEFDLGDGIVWTVNGKEITATDIEDIDFAVTISTEENSFDTIPVEVLNQVTGEKSHMEISLAHDGEFGFTAVLSLNLEAKNAGLFANLYYYNPTTQAMEFICSDEIAADGTADLTFTHASDYTIVIDEVAADAEEQEGSANQGGSVTPGGVQAPQTGDVSNVTLWTLLLIAGLSMLVFAQKKYVR